MLDIFSTREIAIGTYLLLIIILVFVSKRTRKSALDVIRAACNKMLLIPFIGMMLYAGIFVFAFTKLPFWEWKYIKDIIIWVVFAGVPVCFKAINRKNDEQYFKNIVVDNLKFATLVEFFISSFTFSLIGEFVLQPVLTFLLMLQTYAGTKEEYKKVKVLLDWVIVVLSLSIYVIAIKNAINSYEQLGIVDLVVSFCIPIVFSVIYLPVAYSLALVSMYQSIFSRIVVRNRNNKKLSQKRKFEMLFSCGLSFKKIKSFDSEYSKYIVSTRSTFDNDEFETFVNNFRNGGIIQNG